MLYLPCQEAIRELECKILGAVLLGIATTAALVAGFVVQLEHALQTFIAMLISNVLAVSFYVLYEVLRLRALYRYLRVCVCVCVRVCVMYALAAE